MNTKILIIVLILFSVFIQPLNAQRPDTTMARELSEAELAYLKTAFQPDSSVAVALNRIVTDKYARILSNYRAAGTGKATDIVKNESAGTDAYSIYPALYDKKYVADFLEQLKSFREIQDTTIENIKLFFHATITANKYLDWGKVLNNAVQYYLPDTALFSKLYHTQFEKEAYELSAAEYYDLINLKKVSPNETGKIMSLVKEKNYAKAVLQYTYSVYHAALFNELITQSDKHYDSAIEAFLLLDGSLVTSSQFAIALKYKNLLKLRPTLADTLLQHAMYLSKRRDSILNKDPFANIDFGAYEAEQLNNLLTEEQYSLVLSFKNRSLAKADAETDWAEMELRGITAGFDKAKTIAQITNFYIVKYNAWNRLANDKIKQWAAIKNIGDNKPQALKVLDPLRWGGATRKTSNNLNLKW